MTTNPLFNQTRNVQIAENVEVAKSFWQRLRGLIGRPSWPSHQTLWFDDCNTIHTCFMQFSIDVVFVDKEFKVKKIIQNLKPWRWVPPVFHAHSVFEFAAGSLSEEKIRVGDQLHVGH